MGKLLDKEGNEVQLVIAESDKVKVKDMVGRGLTKPVMHMYDAENDCFVNVLDKPADVSKVIEIDGDELVKTTIPKNRDPHGMRLTMDAVFEDGKFKFIEPTQPELSPFEKEGIRMMFERQSNGDVKSLKGVLKDTSIAELNYDKDPESIRPQELPKTPEPEIIKEDGIGVGWVLAFPLAFSLAVLIKILFK